MPARANLREPELTRRRSGHRPAKLRRHRLHSVTDPQHRNAEPEDDVGRTKRRRYVNRLGPAGQDDPGRGKRLDGSLTDIEGLDLTEHPCLAHTPRDQLSVLRSKIEDQNAISMDIGRRVSGPIGRWVNVDARLPIYTLCEVVVAATPWGSSAPLL